MEGNILLPFDAEKLIIIKMDMLDYAVGVILNQLDPKGKLRSVTFYLRKITKSELNYKIYNKKLLAIVTAFKE